MSSPLSKREQRNAAMLLALQEAKGTKGVFKTAKFSFEIVPSRNGARISASLDLDRLSDDLQRFVLQALSPSPKLIVERAGVNGAHKNQIMLSKEVGEAYLEKESLQKDAKRYALKAFGEPMNSAIRNLIDEVKNPGFPGNPLTQQTSPTKEAGKGAISRFISRMMGEKSFGMG